jgi:hypothetical protein
MDFAPQRRQYVRGMIPKSRVLRAKRSNPAPHLQHFRENKNRHTRKSSPKAANRRRTG